MRVRAQRRFGVSLALLGFIVGVICGLSLGRALLMRTAKMSLSEYGQHLTQHGDELTRELQLVFQRANASPLPYCSDRELGALQAQTFHSRDLKDIGRTHGGKLDCSAFLGRLARPYVEGPPTLVLKNGMGIYTEVAVVLASYDGDHATVVEDGAADAVISPHAFDHWDRPHTRYTIIAINRETRQMAPIAGSVLALEPAWIWSPGLRIVSGVVYQSRCSALSPMCAVTAESTSDIWDSSVSTLVASSAMGGVAGLSLGLTVALLYLRTTNLGAQFHRAIRRDSQSLRMLYQPILDIRTRRRVGCEALLRWTDQHGVSISPEVFVRIAEGKGFAGELTAMVLNRAIGELAGHMRQNPEFVLTLNVTASDFGDDRLYELLAQQVLQAKIRPEQIALEGYKVYIDDFGTGFSSLSYLDQLAVNAIKIDRAFTRTIGTDAVMAPILPLILAMAESLGIQTIVEGVETAMQSRYLESARKPLLVQGRYYSSPVTADVLIASRQHTQPPIEAFPPQTVSWP
jgi:sensor c-di-GMP phosphodiesterase-like protein